MWLVPTIYTCDRCGFEGKYNGDDVRPHSPMVRAGMICPQCWDDFILKHVGLLKHDRYDK